jgi:DNA mismatch repair ATPase MutS
VNDLDLLQAKRANYLGAVYVDNSIFGFAYADLTTGEFRLTQLQDRQSLFDELARVAPAELLVSDEQKEQFAKFTSALGYDSYAFLPEQAAFTLSNILKSNLSMVSVAPNAAGDRRCGRNRSLSQAPASAKYRSCHGTAFRCAQRSRVARCCYPNQSRVG